MIKLIKLNTRNEQDPQQDFDDVPNLDVLGETEDFNEDEKTEGLDNKQEYVNSENFNMNDYKDHQRHYKHHTFGDSNSGERHHLKNRNSGKRRHRSNLKEIWPVIDDYPTLSNGQK